MSACIARICGFTSGDGIGDHRRGGRQHRPRRRATSTSLSSRRSPWNGRSWWRLPWRRPQPSCPAGHQHAEWVSQSVRAAPATAAYRCSRSTGATTRARTTPGTKAGPRPGPGHRGAGNRHQPGGVGRRRVDPVRLGAGGVGAHLKLGIAPTGARAGLDVADEPRQRTPSPDTASCCQHLHQWSGKGSDMFDTVVRAP